MNLLKAAVIVGLSFGAAACHQTRQPLESARAETKSIESAQGLGNTGVVRTRSDAYIGEIFAEEEKVLATKPPREDAPSF
jgi:hypothetical protein